LFGSKLVTIDWVYGRPGVTKTSWRFGVEGRDWFRSSSEALAFAENWGVKVGGTRTGGLDEKPPFEGKLMLSTMLLYAY
jgi:hypothetical protein